MNTPVQIRNLSPESLDKLKMRAAMGGLSLSSYLRLELEKMAKQPTMAEWLETFKDRPRVAISAEDIVRVIREGREERDQQLLDAAKPALR